MSSEPALRVSGLSKCYQIYSRPQDRLLQSLWRGRRRFYREFWALRDVSFEVRRGEAVGVIGRNGSGKSTLLQLVVGTLAPTAGEVETHGRIAALLELGSGFSPEFTGRENVVMNAAILGLDADEVQRRMPDIEAFAGIGDFIDQPVKTYSSGMVMRLAFAVSVHVEPEILVVDEALAVGDISFQFRCLERLHRLARRGTTLLFVSHDMGLVKAFCDRALYLVDGRLRATGPPEEIAELYVSDTRDLQKQGLPSQDPSRCDTEPVPASANRVVDARFTDTQAQRSAYSYGEEIRFEVEVELDGTLNNPALSALIQDRRMIAIVGKTCPISTRRSDNGSGRARVLFTLPAIFDSGNFFVALRLEDRLTPSSFMVAEKRTAVLEFEMLRKPGRDFLGLVDISMMASELNE
jgi:lipopolysaccharide transport system ATP-binding protein